MLSPSEAFKFGFLLRCADEGLDPAETSGRIKLAAEFLRNIKETDFEKAATIGGIATGIGKGIGGLASLAKNLGIVGLLGSGAVGLGGGYLAGRLTDKEVDPDEIKQQELIAAYQQEADRIRRAAKLRAYRNQQSSPRRPRSPSLGLS